MFQRNGAEKVAIVALAYEAADGLVHASLTGEQGVEVGVGVGDGITVKAFEERVAAIEQPHIAQGLAFHAAFVFCLNHNGWQLLVVANHHQTTVRATEQRQKLRFEHLTGFVENHGVEGLQTEQFRCARQAGHCAAKDVDGMQEVEYLLTVGTLGYGIVHEVLPVVWGATEFLSEADEGTLQPREHGTDFVDGAIGVGHQEDVVRRVLGPETADHVAKRAIGLSAARRADNEEIVLLGTGTALTENELLPLWGTEQEGK